MVIIDAGHGGSDPGGGSNSYWVEKDLNLKISLYQYNRLKSLGVPVALTRNSDITLNPDDRINKVKSLGGAGDILISNHFLSYYLLFFIFIINIISLLKSTTFRFFPSFFFEYFLYFGVF